MTEAVAIATAPDREVVLAVMRAGARGIIDRTVHGTSLVRVVRRAAAGEITLPRRHFGYVLDEFARVERRVDANVALTPLSSREREVLALIGKGSRNREIGEISRSPNSPSNATCTTRSRSSEFPHAQLR